MSLSLGTQIGVEKVITVLNANVLQIRTHIYWLRHAVRSHIDSSVERNPLYKGVETSL